MPNKPLRVGLVVGSYALLECNILLVLVDIVHAWY